MAIYRPQQGRSVTCPEDSTMSAIDRPALPTTQADGQKLGLVFSGLMLALVLAALDQNIVGTALPRIVNELGGLAHLSWVVTAFMVASPMTTPLSHTGRYKALVTTGLLAAALSFAALAWSAQAGGSAAMGEVILVVLGLGIGVTFPNLITAIQNAVERSDLGAATAMSALFRSLGSAVGVALSGAILTAWLQTLMSGGIARLGPDSQMPAAGHAAMVFAYRHALAATFLTGAMIAFAACLIVALSPERPLTAVRRP
jgi:MFS family permease